MDLTMRPCHNPYGGVNPLIDKMIGNAYDIVKYVARHLKEIRYLAENMSTIYDVAHGYRVQLNGNPQGNNSFSLAIPNNIAPSDITGLSAIAMYSNQIFVPSPETFSFGVNGQNVIISINDTDMPDLVNADFKITLATIPPSAMVDQE